MSIKLTKRQVFMEILKLQAKKKSFLFDLSQFYFIRSILLALMEIFLYLITCKK